MNWDTIQGNWKQMMGTMKEKWGDLTDNELMETKGEYERLSGLMQEKYGIAKEEADRRLDDWAAGVREGIKT